ncbi:MULTISPECIES: xanthine phosphoribosyltransferase [unclassified Butyrivibrio]|uniref:xanthine phosphoribosyltransferase n=1 Tax=unclassified Butyrivibrio TaxID=2639466 RepID=UPI0003B5321F|nr:MULTISPECIES: xanthine phosphoribosyltransferase [unclassified Butyrivibrio]SEM04151.1 xanthine phosphoribosyltransferase [Butyrivibrio sp. ob235]
MKILEEKILECGKVYPGNILKVDSFLNHQIDVGLLEVIGEAFYEKYKDRKITRILTIEASGIPIACAVAKYFGVPVVFAKKSKSLNIGDDVYVSRVSSFTYGKEYDATVSREYLNSDDHVLLIDDFIAIGNAMKGLVEICDQAGAKVEGIGICIEKGFQQGGADLRQMGYDVTSLAIIDEMKDNGEIIFREAD